MRMSSGEEIHVVPNQVLVKYKTGREFQGRTRVVSAMGATRKMSLDEINVDLVRIPAGETIQSFIEKLKLDPNVEYAEPNGVARAFVAPNDPDYDVNNPDQYYLQSGFINVEPAWDITQGTATVVIAVVDTGADLNHVDLVNQFWTNPNPSGTSGLRGSRMEIDWNGDGDCTDTDPDFGPEQCASSDPTDDNTGTFHGTRVSGIAAAQTNNGVLMAGIARNSKIMAVKVLNASGFGTFSAIAQGINFAVNNGASVINLSLGGSATNEAVREAIKRALERNIVVVAASGNTSTPPCAVNFPANYAPVIAVGATETNGSTIASFSCLGSGMDLVAPGVGIVATVSAPPNTTTTGQGTSFATPMVSGVAALIKALHPTMSVNEIVKYIDYTATDLGNPGYDTTFGFGRLNAGAAVIAANNRTLFVSSSASSENETYPYPNPFRPSIDRTLTIRIPPSLGNQNIEITVMNTAGETVKKLSNTNVWDGRNEEGNLVASGLYFYFVKTSAGDERGKLTVIK